VGVAPIPTRRTGSPRYEIIYGLSAVQRGYIPVSFSPDRLPPRARRYIPVAVAAGGGTGAAVAAVAAMQRGSTNK